MALSKTVISLFAVSSMLIATPVMAAENAAARLSVAGAAKITNAGPATPSVAKERQFLGKKSWIIVLILLGLGGVIAAASGGGDGNGGPASP